MRAALYIGATGMKALSDGMNVITNNLANISTTGYKQQDIQFSDVWYAQEAYIGDWWDAQQNTNVALGQKGEGVQVDDIRTLFQQGDFQSTNTVTDLAISGTGFFHVKDLQGRDYYTRAGDFRSDNTGAFRNSQGFALMGYNLADKTDDYYDVNTFNQGELSVVTVDKETPMAAKATTELSLRFNMGQGTSTTSNATDPYFSLLCQYNAANPTSITDASGFSETFTIYDTEGVARQATIAFDGAPSPVEGGSMVEYVITVDGDTSSAPAMAGTLRFDGSGQLKDMSAYTHNGTGLDANGAIDLTGWSTAPLSENGYPQMNVNGSTISLDLGISAANGWLRTGTAAEVRDNMQALAAMGSSAVVTADATTNYAAASAILYDLHQDGYAEGTLNDISIDTEGRLIGRYSNNQSQTLWQIPVCRFTSEYNLRREGNNYFSATDACGTMTHGVAGTENYGKIASCNLEQSNVDMASEMVDMIITQRGFQSNSKVVTTADEMLRRAMELKR